MYPLSITDPIIETIVKSYNYRKDDTSDGNYKWMPKKSASFRRREIYSIRLKPRVFSLIEYIFSHSDNTIFLNCLPRSS